MRHACTWGLWLVAAVSQATDPWEAVATEYERAFESWAAERMRSGAWATEEGRRDPGPAAAFHGRFEALARTGDGRAVLWLLQNAFGVGEERARRQEDAFELLRHADEAEWTSSALGLLPGLAQSLDAEELGRFLERHAGPGHPRSVRAAAQLAQAALLRPEEAERADELRLSAALLRWSEEEPAGGAELAPERAQALALTALAALEQGRRSWLEGHLYEGSDGALYPRADYVPDPREAWEPALEVLARRGSAAACAHVLFEGGSGADDLERRRSFLDRLVSTPLDAATRKELGWNLRSLMRELGAGFVAERLAPVIEAAPDGERALLLFGLGDGLCEAGGETRERGLALLCEVAERWPEEREGQRARGRIFRYTNLVVGQRVPDFEAEDADGHAFKLSDYRGKVTVIDFWGFW